MKIQHVPSGPFLTKAYIASCPATSVAAIIDPSPDSTEKITNYITANSLIPKKILLTHSHWDHIADVYLVKRHYPEIPVFIHPLDAPNLIHPGSDGLPYPGLIQGVEPDHLFVDGETLSIGEMLFKVIHTPGHTPGGVCFYFDKEGVLFSGDTLFKGSIGNLSFPSCVPDKMWPSLDKLAKLPPETQVYPGHGLSTTIGSESWLPNARKIFGNQ